MQEIHFHPAGFSRQYCPKLERAPFFSFFCFVLFFCTCFSAFCHVLDLHQSRLSISVSGVRLPPLPLCFLHHPRCPGAQVLLLLQVLIPSTLQSLQGGGIGFF